MAVFSTQDRNQGLKNSNHSRSSTTSTRRPRRQPYSTYPPVPPHHHGQSRDDELSKSSTHSTGLSGDSSHSHSSSLDLSNSSRGSSAGKFQHSYKKPVLPLRSQYVAMDCEMVGSVTGKSMCARVVLTNWKAKIIYDSYVKPTEEVGDYRTFISGITAADLEGAPSLETVRVEVEAHLKDKILVGHGLENDLSSLEIQHPWWMVRDTAYYPPFQQVRTDPNTGEAFYVPRKLKDLCSSKLQREIQTLGKAHSPSEDAIAALDLYKSHRPRWEACVTSQLQQLQRQQRQFFTTGGQFAAAMEQQQPHQVVFEERPMFEYTHSNMMTLQL